MNRDVTEMTDGDLDRPVEQRPSRYGDQALATRALETINAARGTKFEIVERLPGAGKNAGVWTVKEHRETSVLKWSVGATDPGPQERAAETCAVLRQVGAPVPRYRYVGMIDGGAYAVMDMMHGRPPGPGHFTSAQMQDLLRIVELQAGRALGPSGWPDALIARILESDGDYSFPELMRSWSHQAESLLDQATAIALESRGLVVRAADIVHQDMNPSNIFVEGDFISAIVDWENTTSGDRGWDVTEILFCCWEHPDLRQMVLEHLRRISSPQSIALFAADMAVGFASGAMAQGWSDWADRCVGVGIELLDAVGG